MLKKDRHGKQSILLKKKKKVIIKTYVQCIEESYADASNERVESNYIISHLYSKSN